MGLYLSFLDERYHHFSHKNTNHREEQFPYWYTHHLKQKLNY